jgi:hypothetical protein
MKTERDNLRGCCGMLVGTAIALVLWAVIFAGVFYGCQRIGEKVKTEITK